MVLDKQHIILYVSLAIALVGGTYLFADRRAESARTEAAVAKAQLAQVQSQNATFQAQVNAQLAQLQAQNDVLSKALATREQTEKSVPLQNGSLSATQVAQGIANATKSKPDEVSASGNMIQLDLPLGQQALSALQLVPMLQQDKADLTVQLGNEEKAVDLEKQSHASDLKADEAKLQSCQADVKAAKHSTLKTVFKTAGIALGVGIGIGLHFR
jgi:hypothetical protein